MSELRFFALRDRAPRPTRPFDPGEGGGDEGPRRPKVERPSTDELIRRMRKVDPDQARRYRQRTGQ
jgi:hypothetical protein